MLDGRSALRDSLIGGSIGRDALNVADPLSRLPYELNVVTRGQRDPSRRVNYAPSGHKRVRLDPTPSSEELPPGDCDWGS
jgi:hypothetical protein